MWLKVLRFTCCPAAYQRVLRAADGFPIAVLLILVFMLFRLRLPRWGVGLGGGVYIFRRFDCLLAVCRRVKYGFVARD
jgi:hypothetical protein